jgi:diguanylate cyclase (GGDEF)-like protein
LRSESQVIPQPPGEREQSDELLGVPWRNSLLIAIPMGALAFLFGWIMEKPSGQANPFDGVAYPLLLGSMLVLEAVLWLNKRALHFVVSAIVVGTSLFFLSKLFYLLFLARLGSTVQAEMTETFFWVPAVYLLSFLIPGIAWGRFLPMVFSALTLTMGLAYILPNALRGENLGVVHALTQLNLANVTLLALTLAFIGFKERYTATRTRVETMARLAYTDLLTDLPNRLWLEQELTSMLESVEPDSGLALLYIDLDRFKVVNDMLGHEAGDLLLGKVAERLHTHTRKLDTLVRMSGDEFILVARSVTDVREAERIAEQVQASLAAPFEIKGQVMSVTASIGVSLYPKDGKDLSTLLRHADSAMYYVKNLGRNSVQTYSQKVYRLVEERKELGQDLHGALERGEFGLLFHPQYELARGRMVKSEALLRWRHPVLGDVDRGKFIPAAEESGLITSIGAWVLRESCRQNVSWQQAGPWRFKVAVNVSPLQLVQPSFVDMVMATLEETDLEPRWLELELTENIVVENLKAVAHTLARLKSLGVGLAIDDFGTGYSSLAYLRNLPIDTIKIDRSFIMDLKSPRESPQYPLALVQAIIGLAQNLDLEVVAEGIEDKAQLQLLQNLGCHLGQGYLFAPPVPAQLIPNLLEARVIVAGVAETAS